MLLVLVLAVGLPLVRANAIKTVLLIPTTIVAMALFTFEGQIYYLLYFVLVAEAVHLITH